MFILLLWLSQQPTDRGLLLYQRQYLQVAELLVPDAYRLEDPVLLREYVVLVTERYSSQIGWHSFFMKNLREGERLEQLRVSNQQITMNTNGALIERDLEVLLLNAQKKHPDSLDVRFAIANYLFRGAGLFSKQRIKWTLPEILAVFREADKKGIRSAGSMLALHLDASQSEKFWEADEYVRQGLALAEDDPDLVNAYLQTLLRRKEWEPAIKQARKLFELTLRPELKADALVGSARALYGQGQYTEAAQTALGVYRFIDGYPPALQIGLEAYRKAGGGPVYREAVLDYLKHNASNPERFQAYMDFLRIRGITPDDRQVMAVYTQEPAATPLEKITRLTNIGSFQVAEGHKDKALAAWQEARTLAGTLQPAPPDMIPVLDSLIARARQ